VPGSDRKPPKPLGDLEDRLKAARERAKGRAPREYSEGMGAGLRISVELAAAVVVGTGIGIVLDRWLGTSPWLLIVFFILGCAAGFRNVYRTAQEMEARAKERRAEREREERDRSGSERNKT
jgi:ATP synthase protein I